MADEPETAQSADDLLDDFLGVSVPEDAPPKPPTRKPAEPSKPENKPTKTAADDEDDEESVDDIIDKFDGEEDGDTSKEDKAKAEDDQDQSDEGESGRFVGHDGRVKLADGSVTTVAELLRGNLRNEDYTRKTQETGALHRELQARQAEFAQQDQLIQFAIEVMAAALPPQPDPRLLEDGEYNDPIGYTNQKLRWEAASEQLQQMQWARQQALERNAQTQSTLMRQYVIQQRDKLLDYKPELRDRTKLEAYNSSIVKTLARYGKTAEDLAQVYDADIIKMLEHLGNYHQIIDARRAARKKVQGAPTMAPMSPGPRQSAAARKAKTRANDWEVLRKTGGRAGTPGAAALDRIFDDLDIH